MKKLLSGLTFALCSFGAQAGDGNLMLSDCTASINFVDNQNQRITSMQAASIGRCAGQMEMLVYVLSLASLNVNAGSNKYTVNACLPNNGIQNIQAARIVVDFLKRSPQDLHRNGSMLALQAMTEAFPCR